MRLLEHLCVYMGPASRLPNNSLRVYLPHNYVTYRLVDE
jgi:hypothetical protein